MAGNEQTSAVEAAPKFSLDRLRRDARTLVGSSRAQRGLGVLAVAAVLAGCGGGSSGGPSGGGGGDPPIAQPAPCLSLTGGGSGFALGVCFNPLGTVFQPVQTAVAIGPASYLLVLDFPADQPAGLDGAVEFTEAANRLVPGDRDVIGELRGKAYESPRAQTLAPPYTALSDFGEAWSFNVTPSTTNQLAPVLTDAGFGLWEKFAQAGSFNDGYFGVWYGARAGVVTDWPDAARTYSGRVVGVLSPTGTGAVFQRSFGFSGAIVVTSTAAGRVEAATISTPRISFRQDNSTSLTIQDVPINAIEFTQTPGDTPDGLVTGTLNSAAGTQGTITDGQFEANWFGVAGAAGREIAGRVRFTTSNGLIGVASFGARAN